MGMLTSEELFKSVVPESEETTRLFPTVALPQALVGRMERQFFIMVMERSFGNDSIEGMPNLSRMSLAARR